MFQVVEREHAVVGEEEEEAEEAAPHRVRRLRGAAPHDQAHAHLRRGTRKRDHLTDMTKCSLIVSEYLLNLNWMAAIISNTIQALFTQHSFVQCT